jgi:hypothetical protein
MVENERSYGPVFIAKAAAPEPEPEESRGGGRGWVACIPRRSSQGRGE